MWDESVRHRRRPLGGPQHAHKFVRMRKRIPMPVNYGFWAGSHTHYARLRVVWAAAVPSMSTAAPMEQKPPASIRHTYAAEVDRLIRKQGASDEARDTLLLLYQDGAPGCEEAKQLVCTLIMSTKRSLRLMPKHSSKATV
jgi:hypothetical protein